MFVVGILPQQDSRWDYKEGVDLELKEEMRVNGDILCVQIVDTYMNITRKVLALFDYMLSTCPQVRFYMKGDDDIFINPWHLLGTLDRLANTHSHQSLFMYGANISNSSVFRKKNEKDEGMREKILKWQVPKYIFGCPQWGFIYLAGAGVIISNLALKLVLLAANCVNLLFIDDVQITGIMPYYLNIQLLYGNDFSMKRIEPDLFFYSRKALIPNLSPCELRNVWNEILYGISLPNTCTT